MSSMDLECALLALPLEIRLQIWSLLLAPPAPLIMRSLFIRSGFQNVFMSQQAKRITVTLLLLCKQIAAEALPLLYAQPTWKASCRLEALASQIGTDNFGLIKRISVDADDLASVISSLVLDIQENEPKLRSSLVLAGVGLKTEPGFQGRIDSMIADSPASGFDLGASPPRSRRLRFSNLEALEVEAYQTIALTNRGSRRTRKEALRLCDFARQILLYHPVLNQLVQQGGFGRGGSDAIDLEMGRVRWRFLRSTGKERPSMTVHEHEVDLDQLEDMLRALIEMDDEDEINRRREKEGVAGWTEEGFRQYPYLSSL
ncbi:hypothetical protein LTR05_001232 [Lithohypha guttulata]|uniref:F-box protein n=1 Tax=Lithohypha guttulata TaxID=1690604 RepID=A0AAN7YEX0_9EURO|nr:hypothetical protein LTR05_001232 [Lithohypha guttulata]